MINKKYFQVLHEAYVKSNTYLQLITKILSVRNKAAVLLSLIEPHASSHF